MSQLFQQLAKCNEPTFYNDDTYKKDWIVGKNELVEDKGRWPNAEEGSEDLCDVSLYVPTKDTILSMCETGMQHQLGKFAFSSFFFSID